MASDIQLSLGLIVNNQSLKDIRKQIENELRAVGVSVTPKIEGSIQAAAGTFSAAPAERIGLQKEVLAKLSSQVVSSVDALKSQESIIKINEAKLLELTSSMDKLERVLPSAIFKGMADEAKSLTTQIEKDKSALEDIKKDIDNGGKAFNALRSVIERANIQLAQDFKTLIPKTLAQKAVEAGKSLDDALNQFDKFAVEIASGARQIAKLSSDKPEKIQRELKALDTTLARIRSNVEKEFTKAFGQKEGSEQRANANIAKEAEKQSNLLLTRNKNFAKFADKMEVFEDQKLKEEQRGIDAVNRLYDKLEALIRAQENAEKKRLDAIEKSARDAAKKKSDSIDDIRAQRQKEADAIDRERIAAEQKDALAQFRLKKQLLLIKQKQLDAEQDILENINRRLLEEKITTKKGGQASLGRLSDASQLISKVSTKDQEKLTRILLEQETAFKKSNVAMHAHNGNMARSNSIVDKLTKNLNSANKAAFQFGFAASDAASRLAAWATPAGFIFRTIDALRDATHELIRLDEQARRLAFFQSGSDVSAGFDAVAKTSSNLKKQVSLNTRSIINEAKRSGQSIEDVTRASLTVQKIGSEAFESGGQTSPLLSAVLDLKRFEGAEIDVNRAAEILNATLRQENDGVEAFSETVKDATRIAALYVQTANNTSFSVDELGLVMNSILPAFKSLQNAGLEKTFILTEIASQRLGISASKTRTFLGQLANQILLNADAIEQATGIDVVENGKIKGIESIIEVFKVLQKLKGTKAGFDLANLLAEADNIRDAINLADVSEELSKRFEEIDKDTEGLQSKKALTKFLAGANVNAEALSASFNRLRTSIAELVSDSGFNAFLAKGADAATNIVNGFRQFTTALNESKDSLISIGRVIGAIALGTGLTKFAGFATNAVKGFKAGLLGLQLSEKSRDTLLSTDRKQVSTLDKIATARQEGIISGKDSAAFQEKVTRLTLQEKLAIADIRTIKAQIAAIDKSEVGALEKRKVLETQLNDLRRKRAALAAEELAISRNITEQSQKTLAGGFFQAVKRQGPAIIGGAFIAAATLGGDFFASYFEKKTAKRISGALEGALAGATTGALVGSIIPGLGTAYGAIAGGIVGGAAGLIKTANAEEEDIRKARQDAIRNNLEIHKGVQKQIERQRKEREIQLQAAINLTEVEKELLNLEGLRSELSAKISVNDQLRVEDLKLEKQFEETVKKIEEARFKLGQQEEGKFQDRLRLEQKLVETKQKSLKIEGTLALVQQNILDNLKRGGASGFEIENIKLSFDRAQIKNQVDETVKQLSIIKESIRTIEGAGAKGRQDERKKLEADADAAEQKLIGLRQQLLAQEVAAQSKILDEAISGTKQQIDAWESASQKIVGAFKTIFEQQKVIANLIGEKAEIRARLLDVDILKREVADEIGTSLNESTRKFETAQIRISNARAKNAVVDLGFTDQIQKLIGDTGTDVSGTDEVISNLTSASTEISKAFGQNIKDIEAEKRIRQVAVQNQLDLSKFEAEKRLAVLDLEVKKAKSNEQSILDEISIRRDLIKELKSELAKRAERGKETLENPSKTIGDIRNILRAQSVLRNVQGGTREELVNSLSKTLGSLQKQFGISAIRQLAEAAQSGINRDQRIVGGFNPTEFQQTLLSLVDVGKKATIENIKRSEEETKLLGNNFKELEKAINTSDIVDQQIRINEAIKKTLDAQASADTRLLTIIASQMNSSLAELIVAREINKQTSDLIGNNVLPVLSNLLTNDVFDGGIGKLEKAFNSLTSSISPDSGLDKFKAEASKITDNAIAKSGFIPGKSTLPIQPPVKPQEKEQQLDISKLNEVASAQQKSLDNIDKHLNEIKTQQSQQAGQTNIVAQVAPVDLNVAGDGAQAFMEEVKNVFVEAAREMSNGVKLSVSQLAEIIDKGIKVSGDEIKISVDGTLIQQLTTSAELEKLLLTATGGDKAQMQVLKNLIIKSINRELERDSAKVSIEELDFASDFDLFNKRF